MELERGTDFFGHDVSSQAETTIEHCCTLCEAEPKCAAFTFTVRGPPAAPTRPASVFGSEYTRCGVFCVGSRGCLTAPRGGSLARAVPAERHGGGPRHVAAHPPHYTHYTHRIYANFTTIYTKCFPQAAAG